VRRTARRPAGMSFPATELPQHITGEVCQILSWQIMTCAQSCLDEFIATLDAALMEKVEPAPGTCWLAHVRRRPGGCALRYRLRRTSRTAQEEVVASRERRARHKARWAEILDLPQLFIAV
jgi:hypothetical protein